MRPNELTSDIIDPKVRKRNIERLRKGGVALPKFSQLADAAAIPKGVQEELAAVDPDAAHPLNLFRVHWYNDDARRAVTACPRYAVAADSSSPASRRRSWSPSATASR